MFDTTLRYFCAVARQGSIRHAAETLNVAVSAVSRQMANLETQFGAKLFERHARGVRLTPAGKLFYAHAAASLTDLERVRDEIDALGGESRAHIRIASVEGLLGDLVPDAIRALRERRGRGAVTFAVRTLGTSGVVQAVAEDAADVGFAFNPQPARAVGIYQEAVQPLHAVAAGGQAGMLPDAPRLRDLVDGRLILPPDSSYGVRRLIDTVAADEQLVLDPVMTSDSVAGLRELAARGLGVTLLPLPTVRTDVQSGRLIARAMTDPVLRGARVALLIRKDRPLPPTLKAFLAQAGLLLAEYSSTP